MGDSGLFFLIIVINCFYKRFKHCTPDTSLSLRHTHHTRTHTHAHSHTQTCTYTHTHTLDARPPPMDTVESGTEFSHTHFSRDDDLISLQIEPDR